MPSYHFTLFFAVAGVYSQAYGHAWWPYGLAALGLASNVRGHHHWVSDMTAGALVGTAISQVVTHNRFDPSGHLQWAPQFIGDGGGLSVRYTF
jgi:membrane-associated phospholipid phosphatase